MEIGNIAGDFFSSGKPLFEHLPAQYCLFDSLQGSSQYFK
jgi:hypothetical protein